MAGEIDIICCGLEDAQEIKKLYWDRRILGHFELEIVLAFFSFE